MKPSTLYIALPTAILRLPFAIFLLLFVFQVNYAQQAVVFDRSPDNIVDLTPYTKVYIDKTAHLGLDSIKLHLERGDFIPANEVELEGKFQRGKYRYWLHFSLQNTHLTDSIQVYFHPSINDIIHLYRFHDDSLQEQVFAGWEMPNYRPNSPFFIPSNTHILLSIPPLDSSEYLVMTKNLLGIHGAESTFLHPIGHSPTRLFKPYASFYLWTGVLLGMLFFVGLYASFQYWQNKDITFLYYALYVFSIAFYFISDMWHEDALFKIRDIPFIGIYEFHVPRSIGIYIFYNLFVGAFLKAKQNFRWLYHYIRISVMIMIVYTIVQQVIVQWDIRIGWQLNYYLRLVAMPITLYFLIRMWFIKDRLARIIVIGTTFLFATSIVSVFLALFLERYSFGGEWDVTELGLQIGMIIELLFFTLGLSYRTKLVRDENQQMELYLERENAKNRELEKLDTFKSKLYTNLTHEFRTPLTVIKGLTDELKGRQRYKQDEEKLSVIQQNSHRILDLVNQMLELSKLESGKQTLNYVQADIILFLKYLTDSFQSLAHYKKIMLGFYSTLEELQMDFDQEKMQRILSNLLSNALKFTEEYGQVKVSAERIDNNLNIKVSDTGQGIALEDLPYIFERFYQVKKDDYEGTGIGLALVKELVQLLEGSIEVESKLEQGTTFIIEFPIRQKAVQQNLQLVSTPPNSSKNPFLASPLQTKNKSKILLIEDNQDIINYLVSTLASNYQIETAKNGQIGVEKVRTWSPQLILCDIMMPKMNGYEVCDTLKQEEETANIPIILLTAKATQEDRLAGLSRRADAYLKKPFDKEELLITIQNLLQRSSVLSSPFDTIENDFINQFKAIVQSNLSSENLNIVLLCKQLRIGKTKLTTQVKSITGKTPAQYIRHLRLQHAYYLLKTTELSVKEVAFDCGFSSVSAFSQGFKEEFGVVASEL